MAPLFTLAPPPAWSVSLDGLAGLGRLGMRGHDDAHPVLGGMLRGRAGRIELGAYADWIPLTVESAWDAGGMVGAYVPFRRWLDFEAAGTLGLRSYASTDRAYGPSGYAVRTTAAGLRVGASGRAGDALGGRIGAMLIVSVDLAPRDLPWHQQPDAYDPRGERGVRRIGGVDVLMAMTFGLDVRSDVAAKRDVAVR